MDIPDEYPQLPNGSRIPFTPSTAPLPTADDLVRVLAKHRHGARVASKSPFPSDWSDDDVAAAIAMTIRDPEFERTQWRGDKITFERLIDEHLVVVHIRIDTRPPRFWSAYVPWE